MATDYLDSGQTNLSALKARMFILEGEPADGALRRFAGAASSQGR